MTNYLNEWKNGEIATHLLTRNGYVLDGEIPCRVIAVTDTGVEVQYAAGNFGKVGIGLMRKAPSWQNEAFLRMEAE